jgi:serine/threonine protein kinase
MRKQLFKKDYKDSKKSKKSKKTNKLNNKYKNPTKKLKKNNYVKNNIISKKIMVGGTYDFVDNGVYGCAFKTEDGKTIIKISIYNYEGFGEEFRNPIINELEVNLKLKELSDSNPTDRTYHTFFPIIDNAPIYINNDGEIVLDDGTVIKSKNENENYRSLITVCNKKASIFSKHTKSKNTPLKGLIYVLLEMPYGGKSLESYFQDLSKEKRCSPGSKPFDFKAVIDPIINKVLLGLKKLHDSGIYHGDLHTGNILYDKDNKEIKIIDFGKSIILDKLRDEKEKKEYFRIVLEEILIENLYTDHTGECKKLIEEIINLPYCYRIIDLIKLQQEIVTIIRNLSFYPEIPSISNLQKLEDQFLLFMSDKITDPRYIESLYQFPRVSGPGPGGIF